MKRYLPYLIPAFVFLIIKIASAGVRLSDTNIYFYTGYQLLQGQVLYKDVFFTNFPLLPYISAIYFFILRGNLTAFFFTAVIEVIGVGFVIYLITLRQTKDLFLATLSSSLYLFSFIVLSTSDHQSGVFIASLFAAISYLLFLNKRYFLSGVMIAFSLMTKAYFIPIFIALSGVLIFKFIDKRRSHIIFFFTGFLLTVFLIILPSAISAPDEFFKDVFEYSLTRSQGLSKSEIAWFFITHDAVIFGVLIYNALTIRKRFFFGLLSIFGVLFFIFYKDVYYLYLNLIIPFLCISFAFCYISIQKRIGLQKYVLPSIIFIFLIYNLFTYFSGFQTLQKIENFEEIVNSVQKEKPNRLYGINDLTPSLSYYSKIPLLNNITDTNTNIFRKGYLDAKKLSMDAVNSRTMLVAHGVNYPAFGVRQDVVDEIFDMRILEKCKLKYSYPVRSEGVINRINLFTCY